MFIEVLIIMTKKIKIKTTKMSNWGLLEKQHNFDMTKYYVANKNIV